MGFLSNLFAARRSTSERDPEERRSGYTGQTQAGVYVNADTALRNAVVWGARRYLTQTVAQLPARVMRVDGGANPNGASSRATTHSVDSVLNWRANPELAPFQLKETLIGWAVMNGNGYAEIVRDAAGRVTELWPIHPGRVDVRRAVGSGALFYEVSNEGGAKTTFDPMEMFHLRGFGDGPVGQSVIEYAAQSIGWTQATQLFGASYFGNGLNPAGFIENGPNDADAIKRLRAQLDLMHRGPRKSNRWAILPNAAKFVKLSSTPNEAQFIESMQFQVEEICRWFGVPPHKVMHLLRATFSNIEHQSIEVVTDSIAPWAIRFEEEANYKLFGQNRAGFFVKLDLKGLLRGDFKARQEGLEIMRRSGIINADYWCDLEDMPKPPAGLGSKYIVEANMTTLEKVGEAVATPPPPANDQAALAAMAEIRAIGTALNGMLAHAA